MKRTSQRLDSLRTSYHQVKSSYGLAAQAIAATQALEQRLQATEQRLHAAELELGLLRWILNAKVDHMVPPPDEGIAVGGGNFLQIGYEMLRLLLAYGGISPASSILDVGCGIGRVAIPLTQFLSSDGRYEGFDIVPSMIEWCQARITPTYPNFGFKCIDAANTFYNPHGAVQSSGLRFPYEDATFDLVFLTSVFTHMLPEDVRRYLAEIARVLKHNGRLFTTVYLLNEESMRLIAEGRSPIVPGEDLGGYRVRLADTPEESVFYDDAVFSGLLRDAGLDRDQRTYYGGWCRNGQGVTHQDLIVTGLRTAEP